MCERKRMVRLLLEDVTLVRGKNISVGVRLRGGTTEKFTLDLPKPSYELRRTPIEVIREMERLLDKYPDDEVAHWLNEHGYVSGEGKRFNNRMVCPFAKCMGSRVIGSDFWRQDF